MGFLIDLLALLLVPGALFAVAAGLGSSILLSFLRSLVGRGEDARPPLGMLEFIDLLQLAALDLWRRGGTGLLLGAVGIGAAGAASTLVWRALPGTGAPRGDVYGLAVVLLVPAVVLFLLLHTRSSDLGATMRQFGVVFAYAALLVAALGIAGAKAGDFNLIHIAAVQIDTGPFALSASGGLAFLVALAAAALMLANTEIAGAPAGGRADLSFPLVHGLVRAAWLYAIVATLALAFWSGLASGPAAILLFFGKYLLLLLVLGGLLVGLGRDKSERAFNRAWLPLALLSAASLALAAGGM